MKNLKNFEKKLTKEEMRLVKGGGIQCNNILDCPNNCALNPNELHGNICLNHICTDFNCQLM